MEYHTAFDLLNVGNAETACLSFTVNEPLNPLTVLPDNFCVIGETSGEQVEAQSAVYYPLENEIRLFAEGEIPCDVYNISSSGIESADGISSDINNVKTTAFAAHNSYINGIDVIEYRCFQDDKPIASIVGKNNITAKVRVVNNSSEDRTINVVISSETDDICHEVASNSDMVIKNSCKDISVWLGTRVWFKD